MTGLTLYRHQIITITGWVMRVSVLAGVLCFLLVSIGNADPASAAIRKPTNIPAEPLDLALKTLAKERQFQVLFRAELARDVRTGGAVGEFTPEEAIKQLLSGTGLSYKYLDPQTITVFAQTSETANPVPSGVTPHDGDELNKEAGKNSSQDFRVAQVDQGQTPGPSTVEKQDEQASKKKKSDQLQEVVVTGSRIPTVAGNEVQPVRSYTREDIANSGQTTVGEYLNTLPDVSYFMPTNLEASPGAQTVQLHGLPIGTTATLLDGRRLQNSAQGFFDLSNIPLAAIERIDVLPVGASAIYGADALGGAVNTILRKNFNGFEANATLDHASDVNNPSVNLAWGKAWERGSIMLVGSYQQIGELTGAEREPWSSTSIPAGIPASVVSAALSDNTCAPGNVYSVDGSNLPGLSSPEAGIPAGITGRPTIGQFAATAGKPNVCNFVRWNDITPHTQREGVLLSARYAMTDSLDFFTDVLFSHQQVRYDSGPQLQTFASFDGTVASNNPYNPFGVPVNVSFTYPGSGVQNFDSGLFVRPLIGVQGSWLSGWHYEVTAFFSRDQSRTIVPTVGAVDSFGGIIDALSSPNPSTALNPFASGAPGSPQLLSSLQGPGSGELYDDHMVDGQAILRGPLWKLPAGAVQAVIGSEYSQEAQRTTYYYPGAAPPAGLNRNTYAAFSEVRVPLLAGNPSSQGGERLALTLAGRYDHSDDYGGKATWQSGLLWHATETLALRGGYGISYQAPQLYQISGPTISFPGPLFIADPFRGNQLIDYPVNTVSGPNFALKPETGDAWTLGLEYSSRALSGLHASFTWFDLKIANFIGTESSQALIDFPGLFPGAIVRAPPTAADQSLGYLGLITQLNNIYYNFGDLHVAGFDADIRYDIDTRVGRFTPSLSIANIDKWVSAIVPGAPSVNTVNVATISSSFGNLGGGVGWSPRWKGTAALAWKEGPVSMNLAGRYTGEYLDYQNDVTSTHKLGNYWIFDFYARYEVGKALKNPGSWLAGSYVALGAVNVFNKPPPFSYTPFWYDYQEYDIRARYLHFDAGLRF